MDWTLALDRNRKMLTRVVAQVFERAGLDEDGSVTEIPRHARASAYRLLIPAEVALRALIFMVSLVLEKPVIAPMRRRGERRAKNSNAEKKKRGKRTPAFRLFDPRIIFGKFKRRARKGAGPRMLFFDGTDEVADRTPESTPDDPVNARALQRRIDAMRGALEDIPNQVRRLALAQARRAEAGKPVIHPMRPGRRPGHRKRPVHYVDLVARECQQLALRAIADLAVPKAPDTS